MRPLLLCFFVWAAILGTVTSSNNDYSITEKSLKQTSSGLKFKPSVDSNTHRIRKKRFLDQINIHFEGVVSCLSGLFRRSDAEKAAQTRQEDSLGIEKMELCLAVCVSEWQMWSPCSRPCGGGIRKRIRNDQSTAMNCHEVKGFICPHTLIQQERCNTVCPHGGTPSNRHNGCDCRPGWEGKCCTEETICDHPGRLRNGRINGNSPFKYRSVVTFSCNLGYALNGHEELRCQANGTWDGFSPECEKVTCSRPKTAPNVQILNPDSSFQYGDKLMYACYNGYALRGPQMRTCVMESGSVGKWTGFDPSCIAVKCEEPTVPLNGNLMGREFTYGRSVNFTCNPGYKLIGSATLTCMSSGKWLGQVPECTQITCDPPMVPKDGSVSLRQSTYGSLVSFICNEGYELHGNEVLICEQDGNWNGTEPTCKPTICGDPGVPANGMKDGSLYYYPHSVSYKCFPGYSMIGEDTIKCQQNAQWSSSHPTCQACPMHTYMENARCLPCPLHSHTYTEASTSKLHCLCVTGFTGPRGGPCEEIQCEDLTAPENGLFITTCENKLNQTCHFGCEDGYIMFSGSSMQTCQENGEWDGETPTCLACPKNTYKFSDRSCMPCPQHTHTTGSAHMREGCVCDGGFEGTNGGPCSDVDDCVDNNGKGLCEDVCENNEGGYVCLCTSIPGQKVHPNNKHLCIYEEECRNLTEEDAPKNGGLTCHWFSEQNSKHCYVSCNTGFDFPSNVNEYESCGQMTGFQWTFDLGRRKKFQQCMKQFFPNVRLEGEARYFVVECQLLDEDQKTAVKKHFAKALNNDGVCADRECKISDMGIICGKTKRRRRRRDVETIEESLDIFFKINGIKFENINCTQLCLKVEMPLKDCDRNMCVSIYVRYMLAATKYAKMKIEELNSNQTALERLRLMVAQVVLEPESIKASDVQPCPEDGQELSGSYCYPCTPGTHLVNGTCEPCPQGTYQLMSRESQCQPCPRGTATYNEKATLCEVCKNDTYGVNCQEKCPPCDHGQCHPVYGECVCNAGWEGYLCDRDMDACEGARCFPGVPCKDFPAPAVGFTCGPCPPGYHGDGADCVPVGQQLPEAVIQRK